ncbi:zinc ribbon domain-containing protein [Lentzea sp. NPDC051208]|uniref:zinc ribbon domain-containing protein n=1 Tax=Lentzea sp. NPDC051208 TaxID=3154642 RepID=UPI003418B3DA
MKTLGGEAIGPGGRVTGGLGSMTPGVGKPTGLTPPSAPGLPKPPGLPGLPSPPGLPKPPGAPSALGSPPGLPAPPGLPKPPGMPGLPSPPGLPKPPGLPGLPSPPGLPGLPPPPGSAPPSGRPSVDDDDDDFEDDDFEDEDLDDEDLDEDDDFEDDDDDDDDDLDEDDFDEDDDDFDDEDLDEDDFDDDEEDGGAGLIAPVAAANDLERARAAVAAPLSLDGSVDADPDPEEVLPQAFKRRAVVTTSRPTRRPQAGDLLCGECGESNPPDRNFCSRCGSSLRTAVVVKPKWWRRFVPRRGPKVVKASKRPGQAAAAKPKRHIVANVMRGALRAFTVVLAASVFLYGLYPPFKVRVNSMIVSVKDKVNSAVNKQFVPIRPSSVTASVELPDRGGKLASDGFANTSWLAPYPAVADPAALPKLTIKFDSKVTLTRLIVRAGDSSAFAEHGRPARIKLKYSNLQSDALQLKDSAEPQTLVLDAGLAVESVELTIDNVNKAEGVTDVALAELEFFGFDL